MSKISVRPLYVASATFGACAALVSLSLYQPSTAHRKSDELLSKEGGFASQDEMKRIYWMMGVTRIESLEPQDYAALHAALARGNDSSEAAIVALGAVAKADDRKSLLPALRQYCRAHKDRSKATRTLTEWARKGDGGLVASLAADTEPTLAEAAKVAEADIKVASKPAKGDPK